jgi:hypothetical protein
VEHSYNPSVDGLTELLRFPKEPYPGLRPFLGFESALLFGRGKQIEDLIGYLARKKFVAVIGGSGSGKSSLVRAGVIPSLRSYGIPGIGDYWLPVVCTPGTNGRDNEPNSTQETPLRRFAAKFSRLLYPLDSAHAENERIEQICSLLRLDAGFSQIIDAFSDQIPARSGLTGNDACFLFVIDQFEELFHPTNRDSDGYMREDGRLLIERIIDHFFAAHDRCYVVITMRSEHLNDCTGFLELPDAINEASYLVRRLDDAQLKEAIVEPARSYLRVRQREARGNDLLPKDIIFDEKSILDRLLRDVRSIAHDPDHLPLLQHVLSRTWDVALTRCMQYSLPERIDGNDLARAVLVDDKATWESLDNKENVLRSCLIRHANAIAQSYPKEKQYDIDEMLRLLAFKDPNTGMYTQQRININSENRQHYNELVEHGFIGRVNYLYWDREDPSHETLKVSHESFIRGWPRFQEIVDREAERFEEFLNLLRACMRWSHASRQDALLLEGAQLRRLRETEMDVEMGDPHKRARWFRFISFLRDNHRYKASAKNIEEFIALSLKRDEEIKNKAALAEKKQREMEISFATAKADAEKAKLKADLVLKEVVYAQALGRRQAFIIISSLALLLAAVFWLAIEAPLRMRTESLIKVQLGMEGINPLATGSGSVSTIDQLERGTKVAEDLSLGLSGKKDVFVFDPPAGIKYLAGSQGISTRRNYYDDLVMLVESQVNGTLRQLMTAFPWPVTTGKKNVENWTVAKSVGVNSCKVASDASIKRNKDSTSENGENTKTMQVKGEVHIARMPGMKEDMTRALLVTYPKIGSSWDIRPVTKLTSDAEGNINLCEAGSAIWQSPPTYTFPSVALDSTLRYLLQLTFDYDNVATESAELSITELFWSTGAQGLDQVFNVRQTVALKTDETLNAVGSPKSFGTNRVTSLDTSQSKDGLLIKLNNNKFWEFISSEAFPISPNPDAYARTKLEAIPSKVELKYNKNHCAKLRDALSAQAKMLDPSFNITIYTYRKDYCFVLTSGVPVRGYIHPDEEVLNLSVYRPSFYIIKHIFNLSNAEIKSKLQPIATINFGIQKREDRKLSVIENGHYNGWVVLETEMGGQNVKLLGAPWSTAAVVELGKRLTGFALAPGISQSNSGLNHSPKK